MDGEAERSEGGGSGRSIKSQISKRALKAESPPESPFETDRQRGGSEREGGSEGERERGRGAAGK